MIDLQKYNVPVPRYTSYPTVPSWTPEEFYIEGYEKSLQTTYRESSGEVSLYIHLPFCESLCTYCACNTRITKNHGVEEPYLQHVLKEWQLYAERLPDTPVIKEIHLGVGTPTFFSSANLSYLIEQILASSKTAKNVQMSFEGHPGNTTVEHLQKLGKLGFRRLSLGIQDFADNVQEYINRRQTYHQVEEVMVAARKMGYNSINFDVVYGLPGQTTKSLMSTLQQVGNLSPDRIAFYSYAHVPKMRPAQKSYEQFLPTADAKYKFMLLGKSFLKSAGYIEVGMDHFVKTGDELMQARQEGHLHRNFMGYTPFTSRLLIGLGVSAISDTWTGFAQNEKKVEDYYAAVDEGRLPICRGHLLTQEDLFFRKKILDLMCNCETKWTEEERLNHGDAIDHDLLKQLKEDRLIEMENHRIKVLPEGYDVIRIVCRALDARANTHKTYRQQFSQSI